MADGLNIDFNALTELGDSDGTGSVYGLRVYDGGGFYVTLRLSDIHGSRIEESEDPDTGEPQRGLFIPFTDSGVFVSPKRNVMVTCRMSLAQVVSKHHSHLLTQVVDRDVEERWHRLGYKTGFIGFARPVGEGKKRNFKKKY